MIAKNMTGYSELSAHCSKLYPGKSPVIVPSRNENEPLDYIHIYKNEAEPEHWHYIGFGLSDIMGISVYLRTIEKLRSSDPMAAIKFLNPFPPVGDKNGYGFELTFRLKYNNEDQPPLWPCRTMQELARYVFTSKTPISVGDHISMFSPLDTEKSEIKHLLIALDPELGERDATLGSVTFIQLVGACEKELEGARWWSAGKVLNLMQRQKETGGPLLVTDMQRGQSIIKPGQLEEIKNVGSDMVAYTAKHKFSHVKPDWFVKVERRSECESESTDFKLAEDELSRPPSRMSIGSRSESALRFEYAEHSETRYYDRIFILLGRESARVLPMMLDGRLAFKEFFSYLSFDGRSTITFVPEGYPLDQTIVKPEQPFARHAHWLQIYIPHKLREQMSMDIKSQPDVVPRNYSWPGFNLHITVVDKA